MSCPSTLAAACSWAVAASVGHDHALGTASGASGAPKPPYDQALRVILQAVVFAANLAGGIVVGVATVRGLVLYLVALVANRGLEVPKDAIRLSLGRSLALALEFQVGADVTGTALDPSIGDIATLAAIVVLRTVLNYFLGRELETARREADLPSQTATARP